MKLLSIINGQNGDKNGGKIVKSIFDAVVDSRIHSLFTWTGKSSNGQKKMAFCDYKEIVGLFYTVVHLADSKYSKKDCERDLTYKVLKYAATSKRFVFINRSF